MHRFQQSIADQLFDILLDMEILFIQVKTGAGEYWTPRIFLRYAELPKSLCGVPII